MSAQVSSEVLNDCAALVVTLARSSSVAGQSNFESSKPAIIGVGAGLQCDMLNRSSKAAAYPGMWIVVSPAP